MSPIVNDALKRAGQKPVSGEIALSNGDVVLAQGASSRVVAKGYTNPDDEGEYRVVLPSGKILKNPSLASLKRAFKSEGVTHITHNNGPGPAMYGDLASGTYRVDTYLEWTESIL